MCSSDLGILSQDIVGDIEIVGFNKIQVRKFNKAGTEGFAPRKNTPPLSSISGQGPPCSGIYPIMSSLPIPRQFTAKTISAEKGWNGPPALPCYNLRTPRLGRRAERREAPGGAGSPKKSTSCLTS